jgi:uncharacterized membrane protein
MMLRAFLIRMWERAGRRRIDSLMATMVSPRAIDVSRWLLSLFYGTAGVLHLIRPEWFLPIIPLGVPFPCFVIVVTGVCEIVGALALFVPVLRRHAGLMLALYAICVFPANMRHAMIGGELFGWSLDWRYHAPRLALQPLIVWWALKVGCSRSRASPDRAEKAI